MAIVFLLLFLNTPTHAEEIGAFPDLNLKDPASIQEATRVLETEVKLAARPQTYLLIDLVTRTIHIKARGVDLHTIPILAWSLKAPGSIQGTHRLVTRPPINRRKIDPTASVEQQPISLADMPVDYELSCTPPLTITIMSSPGDHPIHWMISRAKIWWRELKEGTASLSRDQSNPTSPSLQLEISAEQAQSLAWSTVDNMPLVVRRSADNK
ncbi:MAG: hypothetical protein OEY28_07495 [Nitrospira sp.]|nr:hypothetical protein [Nitrospira sp.]